MAHILIIEDDPELGPGLKYNFELEGFRVVLATDGRNGLRLALTGDIHLIVLDLMLPKLDGMHILNRLRQQKIDVPVIILSAKGSEADRLDGFRAGCDDYVTKPFSLMELLSRVRAVFAPEWISRDPKANVYRWTSHRSRRTNGYPSGRTASFVAEGIRIALPTGVASPSSIVAQLSIGRGVGREYRRYTAPHCRQSYGEFAKKTGNRSRAPEADRNGV